MTSKNWYYLILTGLFILAMNPAANADAQPSSEERLVENGDTVRAVVALGQINRIVLPFEEPEVRTLDAATSEIQGRVLYIAPETETDVHLLVADARSAESALTLSLVPQRISPRTLTLRMVPGGSDSPHEESFLEPPRPVSSVEQLPEGEPRALLKALVRGEIPRGFQARPPRQSDLIRCKNLPIRIRTLKVLEGQSQKVQIGEAENLSKEPLMLDEALCGEGPLIRAVGSYPAGVLASRAKIRLYVLSERPPSKPEPTALLATR